MRRTIPALVLPLALALTGCLTKETTHTLYVDADGAVLWTVIEKDVRSDEDDVAERAAEESDYLALAARGEQPVAAALRRLGGEVSVRLVRSERPYTVITEARFPALAALGDALASELGLAARCRLETTGRPDGTIERRFTFVMDPAVGDGPASDDEDDVLLALLEEPEAYRVVLSEGRFEATRGFEIEGPDVAVFVGLPGDELERRGGVLELRWSVAP